MATDRERALADGRLIPLLGLGVWQVENARECVDAVRWALEEGYRHIDTAQAYGNEESVGAGLRESGVPREEIFVTTKFFPRRVRPGRRARGEPAPARARLRRPLHHPLAGRRPAWAWPGMEQARELGHARSIGVSNFDVAEINALLQSAERPPVVNQVLFNPFSFRKRLLEVCLENDVAVEAYSPLGTGRHLDNPTVAAIATRHERTPAQVLLRWGIQHGIPQIPKSTHHSRIVENSKLFDFALGDDDMLALDGLDQTGGTGSAREDKWWR